MSLAWLELRLVKGEEKRLVKFLEGNPYAQNKQKQKQKTELLTVPGEAPRKSNKEGKVQDSHPGPKRKA